MTISSRTPEGTPHECPICGEISSMEASLPDGDSCCPSCGHLLWWMRDSLCRIEGYPMSRIDHTTKIGETLFIEDSLAGVEWIMEMEESFEIAIPEEDYGQLVTIADAVRYVKRQIDRKHP